MYDNVVLIPYRNRKTHLDYFINNTVPLFEKWLPNTKVVVVEQTGSKLFNRGVVLNVGFKEYQNKTKYFITHDVDLNPTQKAIQDFYTNDVTTKEVLGIWTPACNTLGGIIKIRNEDIHTINGFPNDIWGWGAEDKALQNRAEFYDMKKITNLINDKEHPEYILRFNDVNDRNKSNYSKYYKEHYLDFLKKNNEQKEKLILNSGLNNLKYDVIKKISLHPCVELILVDI